MKLKIKNIISKYKLVFISIIITLLIEIFICNYPFFRTILNKNNNIYPEYIINNNKITISNINERITSINFIYNNELTDKITYNLSYKAEESNKIININPKVLLKDDKHYIHLDTHSKCKTININLETNSNISIKNIILNKPNININKLRIIFIFIGLIFFLKVKNKSIYTKQYDKNNTSQNLNFIINLSIFCSFITIYTLTQMFPNPILIEKESINKEDTLLMQTEAIMNKQIHLLEEPSKELKQLPNPYDNTLREQLNINYLFDTAYYNEKYYNYFGITPILTSILPFRIITGKYTHTHIFNLIYIFTSIIALYSLYKKLINKYIKKISLCNFYLGFYTILFASNIFTLLRGQKYDIVVTSGILFLLISLNLAISIYNNPKYTKIKLILLGISTSLIVLSKPNLIIYYTLILFFILRSSKHLNKKEKIKNFSLIIIPLSIFAIFQMFLNYIRFDNILEFGAQYQLTSFNMTSCMSITFGKILAGLTQYIFKTISINPTKFPFIFGNTDISLISMNETLYENKLIGLISIPILYIFFNISNILNKSKNKELSSFINISIILSLISIIINTCFGGICEAYSIDFKLILSISAVILGLKWIDINKDNQDINKIFLILCITTIIIMVPLSLTTEYDLLNDLTKDTTVIFKNLFEFWR